jgi:hypothetical protein
VSRDVRGHLPDEEGLAGLQDALADHQAWCETEAMKSVWVAATMAARPSTHAAAMSAPAGVRGL